MGLARLSLFQIKGVSALLFFLAPYTSKLRLIHYWNVKRRLRFHNQVPHIGMFLSFLSILQNVFFKNQWVTFNVNPMGGGRAKKRFYFFLPIYTRDLRWFFLVVLTLRWWPTRDWYPFFGMYHQFGEIYLLYIYYIGHVSFQSLSPGNYIVGTYFRSR